MDSGREDEAHLDTLMGHLADGDRSAFDPIFRALHPRVMRLARLRLGEADAKDATQSTLERVFARASEFTPGRRALPWFYAVAANEIHSIVRRVNVGERRDGGDSDVVPGADDPEQQLLRAELRVALADAIDSLDPASAAAIAGLLGEAPPAPLRAPSATAHRKRISRAYARLRHLLGRFHDH